MRRVLVGTLMALVVTLASAVALACPIRGKVTCPNGTAFAGVTITFTNVNGLLGVATTAADGSYELSMPDPGTYDAEIGNLPPGITSVKYQINGGELFSGTTAEFTTPIEGLILDWILDGPACGSGCWMTGGGAYIDPLLRLPLAVKGFKAGKPEHSFGGNVYPGCSATAGDGGNWNHVARDGINLHFQGREIVVVRCGNVTPPPEPGSSSPKTPFNFIEFRGTGTLKGIHGNKADYGIVSFFARVEDHNEPGSKGASLGSLIDRYYLRVFNSSGDLLVVSTTDTAEGEPVQITDGNLQLHVSSCDSPPALPFTFQ
ncbi:MAG: carboxypeptidase-like regulatory domain-containing protein [Myxococcales bacterium]